MDLTLFREGLDLIDKRIWCRWFHDYGVTVVAYGRFTCKKCGAEFGRDNL